MPASRGVRFIVPESPAWPTVRETILAMFKRRIVAAQKVISEAVG